MLLHLLSLLACDEHVDIISLLGQYLTCFYQVARALAQIGGICRSKEQKFLSEGPSCLAFPLSIGQSHYYQWLGMEGGGDHAVFSANSFNRGYSDETDLPVGKGVC